MKSKREERLRAAAAAGSCDGNDDGDSDGGGELYVPLRVFC